MIIRKEITIGFIVGIIANVIGTLGYILIFSDLSIATSLQIAREQGHIGSILALGALLNLAAFFGFIKLKRDHRAKGVLIATFLTAIIILLLKLF
ncbi:hypothetical protein I215_04815 [Galbibacter marinus]|uniref:Uncharacterized protein n=1 Tax=Galbibacter marinus TaxID=555500 RepID=K2PTH4_9FLAO|nr:hypothetical protein [Galbibacter marinus]EKF55845.1 hypothetical protein I215_04815 [Galbibacter marinus]